MSVVDHVLAAYPLIIDYAMVVEEVVLETGKVLFGVPKAEVAGRQRGGQGENENDDDRAHGFPPGKEIEGFQSCA
jgi:hypothetical protein